MIKKNLSPIDLKRMIEQKDKKICNICKNGCYSFRILKFKRLSDSYRGEMWIPHLFFICLKCEMIRKTDRFYIYSDRHMFLIQKIARKDYEKEMKEGELNFLKYNVENKVVEMDL